MQIGNTDSYEVFLNGESLQKAEDTVAWSPTNNHFKLKLKKGRNDFLFKLLRRGDAMRFTVGFRETTGRQPWMGANDWVVDLADEVPGYVQ